jgi:hypothetical protein
VFEDLVVSKKDTEKVGLVLIQRLAKRQKLLKNLYLFLSLESYLKKQLIKANLRLINEL